MASSSNSLLLNRKQEPPTKNQESLNFHEEILSVQHQIQKEQHASSSPMMMIEEIPSEIWLDHIFTFLEGKILLNTCMFVSKQWKEYVKKTTCSLLNLSIRADTSTKRDLIFSNLYLEHVESLDLSFNGLSKRGIVHWAKFGHKFTELTGLNLKFNMLRDSAIIVLAQLECLKKLKHLNLASNKIDTEGFEAIVKSPYFSNITTLQLQENQIGLEDLSIQPSQVTLSQLTYLDLNQNCITTHGMQFLSTCPAFQNLTYLNLSKNSLNEHALKYLANGVFTKLETLDLNGCSILDSGIIQLASGNIHHLTCLNLARNGIGDSAVSALVSSTRVSHLQKLILSHNRITNVGSSSIASCPHLKKLKHLSLIRNSIDEKGQKALLDRFPDMIHLQLPQLSSKQSEFETFFNAMDKISNRYNY
ncbi:hypothetical protein FDP41_013402 [Naegleria fowleri]|uniref:F-box domain-containing protein n=1 Tax=Naegleria fowleri TaxID=5763 RepID=A0A6A5C2T4_NAEFO|nr:uncharacterized protein FDP41_013402 [Naegleria fowleri]KAF0980188.1 hypothetical protein FDP41_013402 [Naegleria fowleri]